MYRLEIDALNALVKEQQRTNELLELILANKQVEANPAQRIKPKKGDAHAVK